METNNNEENNDDYDLCTEKIRAAKNQDVFSVIQIDQNKAILKPVDESDETISLLTNWRNQHVKSFFSYFQATDKRTKAWLRRDVIDNPNRILFMVFIDGKKIGHAGMCRYNKQTNSAEIDNFIRSDKSGFPGLMNEIEKGLLRWMFEELNLSKVQGWLFADNFWSNSLHQKCGFKITRKFPLKKTETEDGWMWEEDKSNPDGSSVERYGNLIEITREEYDLRYKKQQEQ